MVALLNRKLVSQPRERRTMPRVEVRCPSTSNVASISSPRRCATSRRAGLQIEGDELPGAGTYISVFVEGLNVPPGEIVWSRGNLAGIEVFEELSWTSIIPWVRERGPEGRELSSAHPR